MRIEQRAGMRHRGPHIGLSRQAPGKAWPRAGVPTPERAGATEGQINRRLWLVIETLCWLTVFALISAIAYYR